ncbi:MAG: LacI family DNA-binding transcriptional regulator [Bacteroidetes bacterium]|nr:LacI family DNA-binding transcriptional regulator [Bacteroidota bacterium]MBS1610442.1 LacI family DNA-binding transcriptional regulator [Bacteroidota bacterium]
MLLKTTIQHIADELKLTPATVSRALNNHPRISAETKKLVNETAVRLNYRRNRIASSLRTGKSHTIGVIIPSARINFFGSVVHGIETIASEYGYHTLIYQSEETTELEMQAIEAFLGARVDGILASLAKQDTDFSHYTDLKKKNVPLVLFDRSNDSLNIPSVVIDDYKGGYYATEHLIKQGYKRIAHLAGPQRFQTFQNRLQGYKDALRAYNYKQDESLIYMGDISIEKGKKAADYFLALPEPPDAVFAVEDFSALGLIKRYKEREIKIPEQVGIIGFANEDFDEHISPTLSSIDQQTVQMGREAFSMLLALIEGDKSQVNIKSKIILEPIPYYRESSVRVNQKTTTTETLLEEADNF